METALNIDPSSNLIGVSDVSAASLQDNKPCVLLINAGLLHRVGPNRLNTIMARKLSKLGIASLRIDLSGLGDSMSQSGAIQDFEIVSQDLDKAMDYMRETHGFTQFVLIGICSGAFDVARKAIVDDRVIGIVSFDGMGYRTRRFYINHVFQHWLRRVGDPVRWVRLYRRYRAMKGSMETEKGSMPAIFKSSLAYTDWTQEQSGQHLERLAQRQVKMHFIYTGGASGYYNYSQQFWDMFSGFNLREMASVSYFPSSDHLTMLERHREEVTDDIVQWVAAGFS